MRSSCAAKLPLACAQRLFRSFRHRLCQPLSGVRNFLLLLTATFPRFARSSVWSVNFRTVLHTVSCDMWRTGSVFSTRPYPAANCTCAVAQPQTQQGPDISWLSVKLQQQWDQEKNAHLGNIIIQPGTNRIVFWRCSDCPGGHPHEWEATVHQRTQNDGCPFCKGRRVCKHSSLASQAPDIAASWDFGANASTPHDYTAHSGHRAHWLCPTCKHKWSATIKNRVSGRGSRLCFNTNGRTQNRVSHPTFAACNHPLLSEWDYEANAPEGLHPEEIRLRSNKLVHWVCHKCPRGCLHRYQARPCHRTLLGSGCPCCSGHKACKCNSLQSLFPDVAREWDAERNEGTPDDYAAQSAVDVWRRSAQRGSWQQSIMSRTHSGLKKHKKQG